MTPKHRFVIRVMKLVLLIGQVVRETQDLISVYNDRGYMGGGSDPILNTDFDTFYPTEGIDIQHMTLAQFNETAGALTQILNFMTGKDATKANHSAVINKYRQDV